MPRSMTEKEKKRERLAMPKIRGKSEGDHTKGVQVHHSPHMHLLDQLV
jgi:hypothetical protein